MPSALRTLLLLVLLALAAFLRARDLGAPFDSEFEGFQGGSWAIAARHRLEHGAERVGYFPVLNPNLPPEFQPTQLFSYTNHPLTTHTIDVFMARAFGLEEWALRLPYLLGSLAIVALVYGLGLRVLGPLGALLSATLAATSPGLAFYGALVNYEDLCIPAMLLAIWAHLRWSEKGRIVDALLFSAALFVAVSIDWPAAFLAPAFAIERFLPRGRLHALKRLRASFFSGLASAVAVVGAVALHLFLVRCSYEKLGIAPPEQAGLGGAWERLQLLAEPFVNGAFGAWLAAQAGHLRSLVRFDLALLAIVGVLLCAMPERRCERARVVILPGVLAGGMYLLAFAKHALDQPLFWMYLLPFLCLASGFALTRACALVAPRAFSRRAAALSLALPAATLGVLQWKDLHERFRVGVRTKEVGQAIRDATPPLTNLYVPASAGWNMAYAYYAQRLFTPLASDGAALIAPVDALRDLELDAAARQAAGEHVLFLYGKGLTPARSALVLDDRAGAELAREQARLERALRRFAAVEEQRLGNGLRLLWAPPQDYWGEGVRRNALHGAGAERDTALAELAALCAAAPGARILYTAPKPELCSDHGPLLAGGAAVFFLDPDPTIAPQWIAPEPGTSHARQIEALGGGERAVVLRAEDAALAEALRAALPSLAPFLAARGRLVSTLPAIATSLPEKPPTPARTSAVR
ncbi:MAG: glycosyltransferase family 39 protein [Planctomycetes bacterium]|nr:glycosyltransferase family 39 protein [Planctomycetota bacterium]